MTFQPVERIPLWLRFPAAEQRLRAALQDAAFPRVPDSEAWLEAAGDGWLVRLTVTPQDAPVSETFSAAELRAFHGRWQAWCAEFAARAAAGSAR